MTRSIEVSNYAEDIVSFSDADIELLINKLDTLLPEDLRAPEGEISVAVFTDEGLRKIHIDFLNDSSDTDVITFDGDHADGYSGEICVSAERALDWCGRFSNTASEELSLYIAHGYLHLAGVDDIAPEDAKKMRAAEALALEIIRSETPEIFKFKKHS